MSERKVLNKYYPPDFDVKLIPKLPKDRCRQYVIRTMAPFNMQCNTCGDYIYKGKKFNARKETVHGEKFLGLEIYRFYIKCPNCLAEITFKTDLQNTDYAAEHGATRLFEAEKLVREQEKKLAEAEEAEKTDAMKMLEKRTKMSRFEMDALARLEELRELNTRQSKTELVNKMLEKINGDNAAQLKRQEELDEEFVKAHFADATGFKVKRLLEEDDEELDVKPSVSQFRFNRPYVKREIKDEPTDEYDETAAAESLPADLLKTVKKEPTESSKPSTSAAACSSVVNRQKEMLKGLVLVKKQKKSDEKLPETTAPPELTATPNPLNLLSGYGSSGDSEEDD